MDFATFFTGAWLTLFGTLFVFTIVVFIHELGHYLAGRWCGVVIETFSVGFGPELFGWTDRHGTRWKLSAIPLGGYVKFLGDENAASLPDHEAVAEMDEPRRARSLPGQPVGNRAFVSAAGPAANFVLSIFIFTMLFTFAGRTIVPAVVGEVVDGSPAQEAGLFTGDEIVSINGRQIDSFSEIQKVVTSSGGSTLDVGVLRQGQALQLSITPEYTEIEDPFGNTITVPVMGIRNDPDPSGIRTVKTGPLESFGLAVEETWDVCTRTLGYLGGIIIGRESADQLSGPIGVARISGQVAEFGLLALISLTAFLSVSIGLINLFPIPMLDGGHLVFYAIEAVRGRPVSPGFQEMLFRFGLFVVLSVMLFATWNDITRIFVG